jgi:fibronectin-binding autotransporter adhesin
MKHGRTTPVTRFATLAVLALAIASNALATDYTWSGAANNSWVTPGNWVGGVAAVASSANRYLFTTTSGSLTPYYDGPNGGGAFWGSIVFASGAPSYNIGANAGFNMFYINGDVVNNSANLQTLSNQRNGTDQLGWYLNSAAPRTFNAASGDILVTSVFLTAPSPATLVKTGNFTLTLSNQSSTWANDWGTTTISAGTLAIARVGTLSNLPGWNSAGRYSVANGATLAVGNSVVDADITTMLGTGNFAAGALLGFDTGLGTSAGNRSYANLANTANGALGLSKIGANTLTLGGTLSYTGPTKITAGTLKLGSALTTSSTLQMTGTGTLDLNANNASFVAGTPAISTAVGTTIIDNGAGTGTSVLTINNNSDTSVSLSGLITDGATRKVGLALSNDSFWESTIYNANNTYSGGTLVSGGTGSGSRLPFGIAAGSYHPTTDGGGNLLKSEIGIGAVTLGTGAADKGQLQFDGTTDVNFYNAIVFNTMLGADMPGGVRLGRSGMILYGSQTANLANASYVGNGGTTLSITGKITGSAGLEMRVEGNALTLTLANATSVNDYAGDTRIMRAVSAADIATLKLGVANQIPDGAGKGNVNVVGKLQLNGFSETINGLNNTGAATYSVVENNSGSTAATLTLGGGDANGSYSGTIRDGSTKALGLTKTGTGTQTVGGTLAYTGITGVNGGTLRLGSAITASDRLNMSGTAILDLNGNNATFTYSAGGCVGATTDTITDNAVGTGTSVVTLNDVNGWAQGTMGTLIVDGANGRKVGLSIKNNSMWDLFDNNVNNTYSGGTLVSGGPLNGSRLSFGITGSGTYTPTLSGSVLTKSEIGTGAVTLGTGTTDKGQIQFDNNAAVNSTFYNDIVYNTTLGADIAGGVRLVKNNMILAGTQTANLADVSLVSNGATSGNITGKITGSQGLRLMPNGDPLIFTLTLANSSSVNDYAGDTQLLHANSDSDVSVLKLGAANQIPDGAGKGNVNVVGKLQLNGFSETINGLNNTGAATYSVVENGSASTAVTLTLGGGDANGTYNGTIRNGAAAALSLTKTGAGTQTVGGTLTYTGATSVNGGTLKLGSALTTSSTLQMTGTGTLDLNGNNATFIAGAPAISTAVGTTLTDNAAGTGTSVLTINNNGNTSVSLSGLITDGATRKVGLALSNDSFWDSTIYNANNTYSGGTLVSGTAGNGSRLPFGIAAGSYHPTTDGGGNLVKSEIGIGAVTLGTGAADKGQLQFHGTTDVNFYNAIVFNTMLGADLPGGVRLGRSGMVLHGTQTANLANASYVGNGGTTLSVTGKITGSAGLEMHVEGNALTLTLANATSVNDYTGDTRIMRAVSAADISTLKLGAVDQIPDGAGKGNVNVVGKLQLNGFSETINGLNNTGAATYSVVENGSAGTAATLTLGGGDANGSYNGTIRNGAAAALGLTKTGAGTQTLVGANLYTGDTVVSQGALALMQNQCLSDSTAVRISGGATVDLNFSGTDDIRELYIGGVQQRRGVYGQDTDPTVFSGTGHLRVLSGPPPLVTIFSFQ